MSEEKFEDSIINNVVVNRTANVNEAVMERIDAVGEMCHIKGIKPINPDGSTNYEHSILVGQNKQVLDEFSRGFFLKKKATRLAQEDTTTEE